MAKEVKQEKKKSKHTGAKVSIAALILAALFGGGFFAFGGGEGMGIGGIFKAPDQNTEAPAEESEKSAEPTEPESTKDYQADTVLEVVITETGIVYEGKTVTAAELETAILSDFSGNVTVTVRDDHAIKSTYDEVTALLTKLNVPYSEVK
ncbi:MAG: hypothetical protein J6Y95_02095 [Lachnospiraceae bacterium]|nr:hypothetical protein [Lachnospiraceae bacterium]